MTDDSQSAAAALRERVRALETMFLGTLKHEDATRLMESMRTGDDRILEIFGGRLNDFRHEMRDAFKHAETQSSAATFRAITELEARLKAEIPRAVMDQFATLLADKFPERAAKGWHPSITWGGGGLSIGAVVIYLLTGGHIGAPG